MDILIAGFAIVSVVLGIGVFADVLGWNLSTGTQELMRMLSTLGVGSMSGYLMGKKVQHRRDTADGEGTEESKEGHE